MGSGLRKDKGKGLVMGSRVGGLGLRDLGFELRNAASAFVLCSDRQVDTRLPGNGNSNPHGQGRSSKIISMIKWIRTSRVSIKKSLSLSVATP